LILLLSSLALALVPHLDLPEERFSLDEGLQINTRGLDPRTRQAAARAQERLNDLLGAPQDRSPSVRIRCRPTEGVPQLETPEGYTLDLRPQKVTLTAEDCRGALWGLQTLVQLAAEKSLPRGLLQDTPRAPWRGLLIDPARHFLPQPSVLRVLDAMEVVKLNTLHFHLSDDQSFRVRSETFPRLGLAPPRTTPVWLPVRELGRSPESWITLASTGGW